MRAFMRELSNDWLTELISDWMSWWMDGWKEGGIMCEWIMHEWTNQQVNEWTNEWTNGQVNGWKNHLGICRYPASSAGPEGLLRSYSKTVAHAHFLLEAPEGVQQSVFCCRGKTLSPCFRDKGAWQFREGQGNKNPLSLALPDTMALYAIPHHIWKPAAEMLHKTIVINMLVVQAMC